MAAVVESRGFFPSISATEQQILGLLHNMYYLVTNGLPVDKSSSLHSLVNFQLEVYTTDHSEQGLSASSTDSGTPVPRQQPTYLSKSHSSNYSSWEFVHALNSVVENTDISKLKAANFFHF